MSVLRNRDWHTQFLDDDTRVPLFQRRLHESNTMVCATVKRSVAEYIGVDADLAVTGNYAAIYDAVSKAVADDATLEDVPLLRDFPVEHLHSLELALVRVAEALPPAERAATATALLKELRRWKKLLAHRRYDKKHREKVRSQVFYNCTASACRCSSNSFSAFCSVLLITSYRHPCAVYVVETCEGEEEESR